MRKIFITMITISLLSSCVYTKMTHLNEDDLEWMSSYEKGDFAIFESKNNMDTVIITDKDIHNSLDPFMQNEGSNEYIAGGNFELQLRHQGKIHTGYFSISKEKRKGPVRIKGQLCERYGLGYNNQALPLKYSKVIIAGRILKDCMVIDKSNSDIGGDVKDSIGVKNFVWSKSKGLVKYELNNGDIYYLTKVSHPIKRVGI